MNQSDSPTLWRNARICFSGDPAQVCEPGAIAVRGDRIAWIGMDHQVPSELVLAARNSVDLEGRWITPGLIDCHTHLVYGGCRAGEFGMRLCGASYEQIARSGGGINSTVLATRMADEESLFGQAARRLQALLAEGVTAVEIKSGYGLNLDAERKILKAARRLGASFPVTVYTTFLGAHAVPPEFTGRPDDYIQLVCREILPVLYDEGLVDAVDVFCESIAFTLDQAERVFDTAIQLGLPVKIHAEQLSNTGGARLAARFHALSADHLEHLDEAGGIAMKSAGTVAVLLPSASYFLSEAKHPPVGLLRRLGVPMALATDSNPGTSPNASILLAMNMACTIFRMTPAEALLGVTRYAARALGKEDSHGVLAAGRYADFCVWDIESLAELAYWMGFNPLHLAVRHGAATPGPFSRDRH
jgi:imidazolonepropionase